MADKFFRVTVSFIVEEDDATEGLVPFTDTVLHYHNMPIQGVAVIEREMINMCGRLRDFGDKQNVLNAEVAARVEAEF